MARPTIVPITSKELPAFAKFLSLHLDPSTSPEGWIERLSANWASERPDHGLAIFEGGEVVGGIGALYADRTIAGRKVRTCNITSWCVLESHRQQSMRLAMQLTRDKSLLYTDFSPTKVVAGVLGFLKFTALDDRQYLVFNRPALGSVARVVTSPEEIEQTLTDRDLQAWRDHRRYPWLRHLAIRTAEGSCYVVYKVARFKGLPSAKVIHVSDPAVLEAVENTLFSHFLWRGLATTQIEARATRSPPALAVVRSGFNPKQFLGEGFAPQDIDYLYSESVAMDL